MHSLYFSPELDTLIRVAWVLLIPVGALLVMVLYQLVMFLFTLTDLVSLARFEVVPTLKNVRLSSGHAEVISGKAVDGVNAVQKGVDSVIAKRFVFKTWAQKQAKSAELDALRNPACETMRKLEAGTTGFISGLQRAFKI